MSLLLWRKLHHGSSAVAADAYAVGGNEPEFVADFAGVLNSGTEYYRSGGSDTTFSSVFTHSGLVAPATMVDSDGVLKWAPHNFLVDSVNQTTSWSGTATNITTAAATTPSGVDAILLYEDATTNQHNRRQTVAQVSGGGVFVFSAVCKAAGRTKFSFYLFEGGTIAVDFDLASATVATAGTATGTIEALSEGWYFCRAVLTIPSTVTTETFYVQLGETTFRSPYAGDGVSGVYVGEISLHRSDLGGMVNNPDRGDSYVPTTTAARFLPRRNHHIYNGTSWEKAGILIEPAAATNLLTFSNDFDNAAYSRFQMSVTEGQTNEITGQSDAVLLTGTGSTGTVSWNEGFSVATSTAHSFSIYAKAGTANWLRLGGQGFTTPSDGGVYFNLSNGTIGTQDTGWAGKIENVASGWYRCSVTFTTDASDSFGVLLINVAEADNDISWASISSPTMYVYGLQFEVGSVPTSYIPTAGTTVTRAAETLTVAGANLPNSTVAMTHHTMGRLSFADSNQLYYIYRRYQGFPYYDLKINTTSTWVGAYSAFQYDSSFNLETSQQAAPGTLTPGVNVPFNAAVRNTSSVMQLAADGTAITADTSVVQLNDFSANPISFGDDGNGGNDRGVLTISLFRMWGTDIGTSGIEEAST